MELISVIVPVYNVEKYLDRCVQSIVDQTYRNLEIILVDDGSPDRCPAMCDAWAEKDSRIKVIHKENGGLSDARNAGMAAATGTLIGFVDSDDRIHPEMYRLLAERMRCDGSDIAACGAEMVFEDGSPSRMLTKSGSCILDAEAAMLAVIEESWLKQPVWYKLYKTELIRHVSFPVGKCHEDVFWTYQAVGNAARVSVFDTPCYFYTQRPGSIMGEGYSLKRLDGLEAKQQRIQFVAPHFPNLLFSAKRAFWFACIYAGQQFLLKRHNTEKDEGLRRIRELLRLSPIEIDSIPAKISMHSLWLLLASFSLTTTCKIRNFLRIGT